ncbi:MAG: hypothetical protein HY685_06925 [Chloroflexi bacterium]|nr:hypothetical protein [Chloroflexota bacterium]
MVMLVGGVLLGGVAALAGLPACGGAAQLAAVPLATATPVLLPTDTATPEPTPTPWPTSTPTVEPTPTPTRAPPWTQAAAPEYCAAPEKGQPQDIVGTPASPYFVRQPAVDNPNAPTIVFLGGGAGTRRGSQRLWTNYLSGGKGVDDFRIVLPYSDGVEYYDASESQRTFRVVDEVLACYGGDAAQVHLAGFSMGGYAAFALMLQQPDRFATLLGAPGLFPESTTPERWAKALCGHAVFNGVGSRDDEWKQLVQTTHQQLLKVGIESVYVEFADQGHSLGVAFDETVFFDFWRAHPTKKATKCNPES